MKNIHYKDILCYETASISDCTHLIVRDDQYIRIIRKQNPHSTMATRKSNKRRESRLTLLRYLHTNRKTLGKNDRLISGFCLQAQQVSVGVKAVVDRAIKERTSIH